MKNSNNEVTKPGITLRSLLNLHRRMGIISAFFVIVLSVTGLILHYSPNLNLDTQFIRSNLLLNWYNIEAPLVSANYAVGNNTATHLADALYFNERRIPGSFSELVGLVVTNFGFALATSNQILLLTAEGELVEILGSLVGIPSGMQQIGTDVNGEVYLQRPGELVRIDLNTLDTFPASAEVAVSWSNLSPLNSSRSELLQFDYRASLVSWERILLDIHSGRILGSLGVIVVDVMAILFLLMAITGIWIWSRRLP